MCEYEDGGGADDVAAAEQQQYQEGGDPMAPPGDLAHFHVIRLPPTDEASGACEGGAGSVARGN